MTMADPSSRTADGRSSAFVIGGVGVGFFLAALAGLELSRVYGQVAMFWPATALATTVVWRNRHVSRLAALVAVFLGAAAALISVGAPPATIVFFSAIDVVEVAAGLFGLGLLGERRLDRSVTTFLSALAVVGVAAPAVGASAGAGVASLLGGADYVAVWKSWWFGNAFGTVVVLPLAASIDRQRIDEIWSGKRVLDASLVTVGAAAAAWLTVTRIGQPNVLMAIPIVVAAVRLNPLAAAALGSGSVISVVGASLVGVGAMRQGADGLVVLAVWSAAVFLLAFCISLLFDELAKERERIAESERHFRVAMDKSPFGMALLDLDGRCYALNRALCDILGYEPEDLIGLTPVAITEGDDACRVLPRMRDLIEGRADEYAVEKTYRHKKGHSVWCSIAVSMVRDEKTGAPLHMIAQMQDLTARRSAEAALEVSESRWNFALESAGQGVWDHDYVGGTTFYSSTWARMLGYDVTEIPTGSDEWLGLVHPDDRARVLRHIDEHIAGVTEQFECEFRMWHKAGRWVWILDRGKVLGHGADGGPLRMIGTHTDITERRLLTEALEEEKERLRITLHSIGDGVICTDAGGLVTFMNPIAEQLTGWSAQTALRRPVDIVFRLVGEVDDRAVESAVAQCLTRLDRVFHDEGVLLIGRSGARIDVKASASPVRKPSGEVLGTVLVFQDVTRARTLQKELAQMASHDALTGLKNRSSFERELGEICAEAAQFGRRHALCFLDLDRFKIVNDTAGHAAGDVLLREIGRVIREQMRRHDIIARLGGDEFGILLYDCEVDDAGMIAERLLERIGRVRFSWDGRVYEVGASIGIAVLDGDTPLAADVMSRADVACYAAKAAGRNRVSIYHLSEGDARRHHAELHTAADIRAALDADRFAVYAQEIIDLRPAGRLQRHCELLVRMRDGVGNLLSPGAFIPAAERYGLMASVDRWMIRQVLHRYAAAILAVPRLAVSINLSANSLEDPNLVSYLAGELAGSSLPPHRVRFEITETSLINNLTHAAKLVSELRAAGYAIMLDDFGAGVSSFAYLEHFPADYLKIDGGFVRKMTGNPIDRAIVESINGIGHKIGAVTIAEFVEDVETLDILREIGVDMAQGYHIAQPKPLETLLRELGDDDSGEGRARA